MGELPPASRFSLKAAGTIFSYGDGAADVDLTSLIAFHREQQTQPPGRFGVIDINEDKIREFAWKQPGDGSWINGGFLWRDVPSR